MGSGERRRGGRGEEGCEERVRGRGGRGEEGGTVVVNCN